MRVQRPEEVPLRSFGISLLLLHWHGEERKKATMMRHPADGHDWRTINTMFYKDIGGEVRHLWFALSTDVMNPFDQVRSNHKL